MKLGSHWRTVKEIQEALRFPSAEACRKWIQRSGIPSVRRGHVILVDEHDVDRVLRQREDRQLGRVS